MKFILFYAFKKIKKKPFTFFLSTFSVAFLMCITYFSLSWNTIFSQGYENSARSVYGNTDIRVSIGHDSPNRFESITMSGFLDDPIINKHASIVKSFFSTYGEVDYDDTTLFTSFFVSDLDDLNSYNPIQYEKGSKIDYLTSDEVIIGKTLAKRLNLSVNSTIKLNYIGQQNYYTVAAIAKDTGVFSSAMNDNMILINPLGFRKLSLFFSPGIFSTIVIKANQSSDIPILYERSLELGKNNLLSTFYVHDSNKLTTVFDIVNFPANFIFSISLIFSLCTLIILFKLLFIKDIENFMTLYKIGVSQRKISVIRLFIGLLIAIGSIIISFALIQILLPLLSFLFPIIEGIKVNWIAFLASAIIGALISIFSAFNSTHKGHKGIKLPNFFYFICLIISPISILITLNTQSEYLGTISSLISIISIIILLPYLIGLVLKIFKKRKVNFLILNTYRKYSNLGYRRLLTFLFLGVSVIIMILTFSFNLEKIAYDISSNSAFNIIISNIKNPTDEYYNEIKNTKGVDEVVRSSITLTQEVRGENFTTNIVFLGLDRDGISLFDKNIENTDPLDSLFNTEDGVVVTKKFALKFNLQIGDFLNTTILYVQQQFQIIDIIDTDYFFGNIVFVNLKDVATLEKPYTCLLVNTKNNVDTFIQQLLIQLQNTNPAILNVHNIQNKWYQQSFIYVQLLIALSILIATLIFVTIFILLFIYHDYEKTYYHQLYTIGLNSDRIKKINSSVSLILYSLLIPFLLIMMFIICYLFNNLAIIAKLYQTMNINFLIFLLTSITCIGVIVVLDLLAYRKVVGRHE